MGGKPRPPKLRLHLNQEQAETIYKELAPQYMGNDLRALVRKIEKWLDELPKTTR